MLLVCLSVAFKFLNHVTSCYKSCVNIMMYLRGGATPEPKLYIPTLRMNNVEGMRTFKVWSFLHAGCILCAARPWGNVRLSLVL